MAGDWLKIEHATIDKPEVLRIARILGRTPDDVFGKLFRVWRWFDLNSRDGHVDAAVDADVDAVASLDGFASAMRAAGWLGSAPTQPEDPAGLSLPHFDNHNGETAKTRALKQKRQSKWRRSRDAGVDGHVDTSPSTSASTREEKRREEKNTKEHEVQVSLSHTPSSLSSKSKVIVEEVPCNSSTNCEATTGREVFDYSNSFERFFEAKYHIPYLWQHGDRKEILSFTRRLNGTLTPESWAVALRNYFQSPLGHHGIVDLCKRYPVFLNSPLDRFNKPAGSGSKNEQREALYDRLIEGRQEFLQEKPIAK